MLLNIRHGLGDYIRNNIVSYFVVIAVFLIGIILGAMAIRILPEAQKVELVQYLNIFFSEFAHQAQGNGTVLLATIGGNIKIIVLLWILGFTIIGIPFVLFIIFTRGFIIGFTVGFLVNEYIFKGLLFALVSILPHNFIVIPILSFAGVTAIGFSVRLIRRKNQMAGKLLSDSMNYSFMCLAACILMIVASFIEVYIAPVFMRMVVGMFV